MISVKEYYRSDKYLIIVSILTVWLTLGLGVLSYLEPSDWAYQEIFPVVLITIVPSMSTISIILDSIRIFGFKIVISYLIIIGFLGTYGSYMILVSQFLVLIYLWIKCRK